MNARLCLATTIALGLFSGCAHTHEDHSHSPATETAVDEEALAKELLEKLQHDLEHPPYYRSSIHWTRVFKGMVALGVLAEEADFQIRRAVRTTLSSAEINKLLDRHEGDAEAFLEKLDAAYVAAIGADKKKELGLPYDLPDEASVEAWYPLSRLIDRPPRCGNSLHWLPIYKDLMRLGFTVDESAKICRRSVRAGLSRFEAEELIDTTKRKKEAFSERLETVLQNAAARRDRGSGRGLRAFFKGKDAPERKKKTPAEAENIGPKEKAPAEGSATPPAEGGAGEIPPADPLPGETPPDDPMGGTPPDDPMGDTPSGDTPPGDVPPGDVPPGDVPPGDVPPDGE